MPFFPYLVAIPSGMVVDPAAIHQAHADNKDMSTNVVSSGP